MSYKPRQESKTILNRAWYWVQSVAYSVTARWVFYRLLQDGTYSEKAGYKHLLGLLSKARKEFYEDWAPWTLADDTRSPVLMERKGCYGLKMRGQGFKSEKDWLKTIDEELNCPLDRWEAQPVYNEIWFEAAAMQGQFLYYANENIPLLAFHGDISIPEKWRTALRLARFILLRKPIQIFYYGDLDPKGLIIPDSAWTDISQWAFWLAQAEDSKLDINDWVPFRWKSFIRVGINQEHVAKLNIPENPERPGTYQWEALSDEQAQQLIKKANDLLDLDAFRKVEKEELEIVKRFMNKQSTGNDGG